MLTLRQFVNNAAQVVDQTKTQMALKLGKGQCADMEQYNRVVGRMEGLDQGIALLREMLGQLEASEDDSSLPEMTQVKKKVTRKKR